MTQFEVIAQSFTTSDRIKKVIEAPYENTALRIATRELEDWGCVISIKDVSCWHHEL